MSISRCFPKISVLIPTYHYARFLPETIESVLRQNLSDFEIIISDDASTDASAEIIRRYAARDSRISVFVQPINLGMVANWNWCLAQARGRYLKFLFGDDCLSSPRALEKLSTLLDEHPTAVMSASARQVIDEQSARISRWDHLPSDGLHSGLTIIRQCLVRTDNFIGEPTAVMFRAGTTSRGFDERYRQIVDLEMWCHLLRFGDLVYTTDELCSFRCHGAQQTEANRRQNIGSREYNRLLATYLDHYVPGGTRFTAAERKHLFHALFRLRKGRALPEEAQVIEQAFSPRLGRAWYGWHWLVRRVTRPFFNLSRNWRKHVLRQPIAPRLATLATPQSRAVPATPRIRAIRRNPVQFLARSRPPIAPREPERA